MTPFPTGIASLLAAQERVDRLREQAVRRAGAAICDLAYANSYDGAPDDVLEALRSAVDSERALDLQYTPYGGATMPRRHVSQRHPQSDGSSPSRMSMR